MTKKMVPIMILVVFTMSLPSYLSLCIISEPILDSYSGVKRDTIIVSGSGATEDGLVELYWDIPVGPGALMLNVATAGAGGDYEIMFDVPPAVSGSHYLWVIDVATGTMELSDPFTVLPMLSLSPAKGMWGDVITIHGSGYSGEEQVVVTWDYGGSFPLDLATSPAIIETDEYGDWVASFTVPPGYPPGSYAVYAKDDDGVYAYADANSLGFFVIPEMYLGTIMGLAACMTALGVYVFKRYSQ
jgi:hypothetical protein